VNNRSYNTENTHWFWFRDRTVRYFRDVSASQLMDSSIIEFALRNNFYKILRKK